MLDIIYESVESLQADKLKLLWCEFLEKLELKKKYPFPKDYAYMVALIDTNVL